MFHADSKDEPLKNMNCFFVYILRCSDNSLYTGHTDNLEKRLSEHQSADCPSCYTSSKLPVELVFYTTFGSRDEAIDAERQIKGWSRTKKQALIENDFEKIRLLAKRTKKK
jgi:putative endonuclease